MLSFRGEFCLFFLFSVNSVSALGSLSVSLPVPSSLSPSEKNAFFFVRMKSNQFCFSGPVFDTF